jgi:hypothetical protein
MAEQMTHRDLYLRRTRADDSTKSRITRHRVWDEKLFLAEQIKTEARLMGDGKKFDIITIEESPCKAS